MKAGADFEQAGDAPAQDDPALGGFGDTAEDFKQRTFASAIATDDAHDFALIDLEATSLSAQNSSMSSPCTT